MLLQRLFGYAMIEAMNQNLEQLHQDYVQHESAVTLEKHPTNAENGNSRLSITGSHGDVHKSLFSLCMLDVDIYCPAYLEKVSGKLGEERIHQGQLAGEALVAASRTVTPCMRCDCLQVTFLTAGNLNKQLLYKVERLGSTPASTYRTVRAVQEGEVIMLATVCFTQKKQIPDTPHLDTLTPHWSHDQLITGRKDHHYGRKSARSSSVNIAAGIGGLPIEIKPLGSGSDVDAENSLPGLEAVTSPMYMIRPVADSQTPTDGDSGRCLVAYLSDVLGALVVPGNPWIPRTCDQHILDSSSLSLTLWFHGDVVLGDWLVYKGDKADRAGTRQHSMGRLYRQDGTLLATIAQERMIKCTDRDVYTGSKAKL